MKDLSVKLKDQTYVLLDGNDNLLGRAILNADAVSTLNYAYATNGSKNRWRKQNDALSTYSR